MRILYWLGDDLRVDDNRALSWAAECGEVLPVFIYDKTRGRSDGALSRLWRREALLSLEAVLGPIACFKGNVEEVLGAIAKDNAMDLIVRSDDFHNYPKIEGVTIRYFNDHYFNLPNFVKKQDGSDYKVFTAYYNAARKIPIDPPRDARKISRIAPPKDALLIDDIFEPPAHPWQKDLLFQYNISEKGARRVLSGFLDNRIGSYRQGRDYLGMAATSGLAPYLRFGQISPRRIVDELHRFIDVSTDAGNADTFIKELYWREFAAAQLYVNPALHRQNSQAKFDNMDWRNRPEHIHAWQSGKTGIPVIDAAMRELWQTGTMHNRARMIVGSFLVKNLGVDWRIGETWFWDCLFDADPASNPMNWQWVAGTGFDAAPYFRVFNPVTQSEKFDKDGTYIHRFVPELRGLSGKALYAPWTASPMDLQLAGVELGVNYPQPIVDLKISREDALARFQALKP